MVTGGGGGGGEQCRAGSCEACTADSACAWCLKESRCTKNKPSQCQLGPHNHVGKGVGTAKCVDAPPPGGTVQSSAQSAAQAEPPRDCVNGDQRPQCANPEGCPAIRCAVPSCIGGEAIFEWHDGCRKCLICPTTPPGAAPKDGAEEQRSDADAASGASQKKCNSTLVDQGWWTTSRPAQCSSAITRTHVLKLPGIAVFKTLKRATVVEGAASMVLKEDDWSRDAVFQRFGGIPVQPRDAVEVAKHGPEGRGTPATMQFKAYLESMRLQANGTGTTVGDLFVSEDQNQVLLDAIKPLLKTPGPENWMFEKGRKSAHQLLISLSGPGRGLPMHVHGAAWLLQLQGIKRWYLYPPETNVSSIPRALMQELFHVVPERWSSQLREWVESGADLAPLSCVVSAGEMMLLPPGWHHATQNFGESVAIGGQLFGQTSTLEQIQALVEQSPKNWPTSAHQLYSEASLLHTSLAHIDEPRQHDFSDGPAVVAAVIEASILRFERSLALDPTQTVVVQQLITIYAQHNKLDKALKLFEDKLLEIDAIYEKGFYSKEHHAIYSLQFATPILFNVEPADLIEKEIDGVQVASIVNGILKLAAAVVPAHELLKEAKRAFDTMFKPQ